MHHSSSPCHLLPQDGLAQQFPLPHHRLGVTSAVSRSNYLNNVVAIGYTGVVPLGAYPNALGDFTHRVDLSRNNAGQCAPNDGGPAGTASDIIDNSALWQVLAGAGRCWQVLAGSGGSMKMPTLRIITAPTSPRDCVQAYCYPGSRPGSNELNFLASETSLCYAYSFDSRGFKGVSPGASNGQLIQMAFWLCPSNWDDEDLDNIPRISWRDALGKRCSKSVTPGTTCCSIQHPEAASGKPPHIEWARSGRPNWW